MLQNLTAIITSTRSNKSFKFKISIGYRVGSSMKHRLSDPVAPTDSTDPLNGIHRRHPLEKNIKSDNLSVFEGRL